VARPAELLAAVPVFAVRICRTVTFSRRGAALMLAPGTPAVLDAFDGLAVTKGRLSAPLTPMSHTKYALRYALCDSKEPMPSIQDFYETDDLQVWTYFEPILFCGFFLWSKRKKLSLSLCH
jgi:hypothetical protein